MAQSFSKSNFITSTSRKNFKTIDQTDEVNAKEFQVTKSRPHFNVNTVYDPNESQNPFNKKNLKIGPQTHSAAVSRFGMYDTVISKLDSNKTKELRHPTITPTKKRKFANFSNRKRSLKEDLNPMTLEDNPMKPDPRVAGYTKYQL